MRVKSQTWVWWVCLETWFSFVSLSFFKLFLFPSSVRVSYSTCLCSGVIKDALDRVHRWPANSRCYWRLLASLFNDEPAIRFWSVEPVIEQVQFSSSHAVHPKEAASLGKVRRLGQHIGWFCKIILFKDGCYSATTLSSMISVEIF